MFHAMYRFRLEIQKNKGILHTEIKIQTSKILETIFI